MTVFDWLEGIPLPNGSSPYDVVELRFKNNRKLYVRCPGAVSVHVGDVVVVDLQPGHDVGVVSLKGELVKSQMKLRKVKDDHELKRIARKATAEDIALWHTARQREEDTLRESRQIIQRLGISMKLTDVEFQGDNVRPLRQFSQIGLGGWAGVTPLRGEKFDHHGGRIEGEIEGRSDLTGCSEFNLTNFRRPHFLILVFRKNSES